MAPTTVRRLSTTALAIGTSIALASCGSSPAASAPGGSGSGSAPKGPVTIGAIYPFSGGSAFIGKHVNAQLYSAVTEINGAGGILGHQIHVTDVDTKADPADAVPAVGQFLATAKNLFCTLGPGTDSGPEIVPILGKDHIVMMSAAGQSSFDHNTDPYFYRPVAPDAANGIAMALYAKSQGWTRIATVFGSDQGSQGDRPGVIQGLKALHLNDVGDLNITPDQPSYQSQVSRIVADKPDAIFTETDPTTAATFFGELTQQTTSTIHIVATQAGVIPTYVQPLRQAVGAARFAQEFASVTNQAATPNPSAADFKAALLGSSKYVSDPGQYLANPNTAIGYQSIILTALAAVAAKSIDPAVYNKKIVSIANPGAGKTVVYTYADGVKALQQGKAIRYIGPAGAFDFNQYHNSFGDQAAEGVTPSGTEVVRSVITAKAIQAAG